MKNILIIGITGFLGGNLAKYLSNKNYKVLGIISKNKKIPEELKKNNVVISKIDFNDIDKIDFKKLLKNIKIIIFACGPNRFNCNENYYYEKRRYDQVLKKAYNFALSNKVELFIKVSTIHVYDKTKKIITEKTNTKAENNYEKLHIYADNYLLLKKNNLRTLVLRLSNTFGIPPYDNKRFNKHTLINDICYKLTNLKNYKIKNPDDERNFVSVDSVLKSINFIIKNKNLFNKKVINIGGKKNYSIYKLSHIINDIHKLSSKIVFNRPINNTNATEKKYMPVFSIVELSNMNAFFNFNIRNKINKLLNYYLDKK